MERPTLAAALGQATCVHDPAAIEAAIRRIGAEIDAALDGDAALFLTVMQGGLIFAGQLAVAIATPLDFDYVHATRYRGATLAGELLWVKRPTRSLADRTVLLADDILDEGHTLKALRDYCIENGARRVLLAVLCEKRHDRRVPGLVADFVGVEVPDRYVFGCGMDYYEQGRNLPAIYAL
jgi:hypoxanthine phosphoribosyltransferase